MKPGVGSFHSWSPCILHSLQNLLQQFYQKRKIFVAISFSFKVGSPLTYLNFTTLPVHLFVLLDAPRVTAERLSLCGFQKFMFFNVKESPDALLLSTRLAMLFLTYCH
jgi:hypothetical protein